MQRENIFVCQPRGGPNANAMSVEAFNRASFKHIAYQYRSTCSILTTAFNYGWSQMLNCRHEKKLKYFAMIHADVVPMAWGWADQLITLLEDTGATVISAVIPIKDSQGLTSTALDVTGLPYSPLRLTMTEVFNRPKTFTHPKLLVNTGLWVCRIDDWCEEVCFRQQDEIVKEDGVFNLRTIPEDWDFSRQVRGLGGRLFATREVVLYHEHEMYSNAAAWGSCKTDPVHAGKSSKALPVEQLVS